MQILKSKNHFRMKPSAAHPNKLPHPRIRTSFQHFWMKIRRSYRHTAHANPSDPHTHSRTCKSVTEKGLPQHTRILTFSSPLPSFTVQLRRRRCPPTFAQLPSSFLDGPSTQEHAAGAMPTNHHSPTAAARNALRYRSFLHDEPENIQWRHGGPPTYDAVNKLFEQGRTKEWPEGSLEEIVQNAIKSWEMELSHKTRLQDFKTINPEKFKLFVNDLKPYKADEETFESSHEVFRSAFPRGFAWEVIKVYSGPPEIAFKFRHWGFFEGPYKEHAPTGKMVQFYGFGTVKVDDSLKVEEVEIYYDPAEMLGGLISGKHPNHPMEDGTKASPPSQECPFSK
ncbi:hypothetical protein VNO80_28263 [Phaseolus coccineus]|uniref:Pathogen-related protein n=1 Tax=Phaseolus coccineus TaxID=3886 RepID=A0AAN9LKZ7_PHACN